MKFKLTDGRPWYKQVITGVFEAGSLLMVTFVGIILACIVITILQEATWEGVGTFFKAIGVAVGVFLGLLLLFGIQEWAEGGE